MLHRVKDAALATGIDLVRLECHWGNQNALRLYLAQGMWVRSWKNDIRMFVTKSSPALTYVTEEARCTFFVDHRVVGIADNDGDRLGWQLAEGVDKLLEQRVEATAALCLALMHWPLVRRDSEGRERTSSIWDFESLAHHIRSCEHALRSRGWIVPRPLEIIR
jgi:hypothetical protein